MGKIVRGISCELEDLEDLMERAGLLLTGDDYDKAQDLLQESCPCYVAKWIEKTYR